MAWPIEILFCFEKWNIQDLIIFEPYRCFQSVVVCVHGASFLQQKPSRNEREIAIL